VAAQERTPQGGVVKEADHGFGATWQHGSQSRVRGRVAAWELTPQGANQSPWMQDHMAIQEPALAEGRRTPMVNVPSAIEAMLIGHCSRLTRFLEDVGSQNKLSTHEDKYALPKLDVSMLYKVLLTPLFYLKSIIAK
jgi:hypothetical protein